jgi:soluble lytic murein transglycosylase-like protein
VISVRSSVLLLLSLLPAALSAVAAERPKQNAQYADPQLRRLLAQATSDSDSFSDRFAAEVWLVDMSTRLQRQLPDPEERMQLLRLVHREASRVSLPPELVLAVIDVESNFDRFAISWAGARGLMQIMPFWLDEIGRPNDNLFHVDTNLRFGCTILRYYYDRENGNLAKALARYNGSVGRRVYSDKVLDRLRRKWFKL